MHTFIYKTKISVSYIIWALIIFLIISFLATYKLKGDFIKITIIVYFCLLAWVFILNAFFKASIELTDKSILINYSPLLFFLKPKEHDLQDIKSIVFYYLGGKGSVPHIVIDFNDSQKQVVYSFLLISKKSVFLLSDYLKKQNVDMKVIDNLTDTKKRHIA
jgi:hypothetical protein